MQHTLTGVDFHALETRVWAQLATSRERCAILARAFGAGDIKVALLLGRYPVPHHELDKIERALNRVPGGWGLV